MAGNIGLRPSKKYPRLGRGIFIYFQKGEGLFDAIFYEIHALVPCGGADDDATPSSASQKRTHSQQLSLTIIVVLRGPHQKNAFFEVDISHFKV